jgi:hypothetical protein
MCENANFKLEFREFYLTKLDDSTSKRFQLKKSTQWWWFRGLKWPRTPDGVLVLVTENWIMVKGNVARIGGIYHLRKLSRAIRDVLQAKTSGEGCLNGKWNIGS